MLTGLGAAGMLSAPSIDMMLPALGEIHTAFGMASDWSATGAIITVFFIGLAAAQVVDGPLRPRHRCARTHPHHLRRHASTRTTHRRR